MNTTPKSGARSPKGLWRATALALAALALSACGDGGAPKAKATPVDPSVEQLVDAIEKAHAEIHGAKAGEAAPAANAPPAELPASHQAAIERSEGFKDLRRKLHAQLGPCRLACEGMLTPMGRALVERLDALDAHAIETEPYDLPGLKSLLSLWADKTGLSKIKPPEGSGAAGQAIVDMLAWPTFDRGRAAEALKGGEVKSSPVALAELAVQIKAVRASEAASGDAIAGIEITLAQALVRLLLDFKYFKSAGPHEVTKDKEKYVQDNEAAILEALGELFKEPDPALALKKLEPNDPQYTPLLKVFAEYRTRQDKGGCPELPKNWTFDKGVKPGVEVKKLQERLKCEDYYDFEPDLIYNNSTIEAVKTYQREHNLEETGFVDAQTTASLNVPMSRRVSQIKMALQRIRERPTGQLGDFYIVVNLPSFELSVIMDGKVIRRHRVIIGSNKLDDDKYKLIQGHINRTTLFDTQLHNIVVNPDWILPPRVSKGELVGDLEKNPKYLEENNITAQTLPNGRKIYVQGPGEANVLGKVKFLLTESNSIFLHDTNDPWLFRNRIRTFSHGCMRVDEAVPLARWLLERDGYDGLEIEQAFRAQKIQRGFQLKTPIPTITVYRTVEVNEAGHAVIYGDVYEYDEAAANGALPVQEITRWGDSPLRPRWVPKVDKKTVDQWRAEGKPAPRDLKP